MNPLIAKHVVATYIDDQRVEIKPGEPLPAGIDPAEIPELRRLGAIEEAAAPTEAVVPVVPAAPTEAVVPVVPAAPTEAVVPVVPAAPTAAVVPAAPAEAVVPAAPAEAAVLAEPETPAEARSKRKP